MLEFAEIYYCVSLQNKGKYLAKLMVHLFIQSSSFNSCKSCAFCRRFTPIKPNEVLNCKLKTQDQNTIHQLPRVVVTVHTRNEQVPKAPARNWANCPVPSAPAAVRGIVGSGEGVLLPVK
jgi:hypothetical protein